MIRALAIVVAIGYACLPLFPAFITLSPASIPGVSMVPPIAAAVLLILMCIAAAIGGLLLLKTSWAEQPLVAPLALWLAAGVLSAALGFAPLYGAVFIGIFAMGIIWHAAILRCYDEAGAATTIFAAMLGAASIAFLVAIVTALVHHPASIYAAEHGRAVGSFILPGELAGYSLVIVPTAYAVARASRHLALRALAWLAAGSGTLALVLTFSRTGWVAAACVAIAYVLLTNGAHRRSLQIGTAIAAGTALILAVAFNAHHDPSENYTRLSIWQTALGIARRFPLTGSGPFTFGSMYAHLRLPDGDAVAYHAHDLYLTLLAETGVLGLLAMLATWWQFLRAWLRRIAQAPPQARTFSAAILAGMIGTLVQGTIDTSTLVLFGLWLPTMALALASARSGIGDA